jgi:hypothetical protein
VVFKKVISHWNVEYLKATQPIIIATNPCQARATRLCKHLQGRNTKVKFKSKY